MGQEDANSTELGGKVHNEKWEENKNLKSTEGMQVAFGESTDSILLNNADVQNIER